MTVMYLSKRFTVLFTLFRNMILLTTFVLAVILENAGQSRFVAMLVLFLLFILWIHVRERGMAGKWPHLLTCSYIVDIFLLAALDSSSKYVVNYYFNVYYFFVLISAGFLLKQKHRLLISFAVIAAAFIKYYRYLEAQTAYNLPFTLSYIFFTLMIFVTIAVFFNYSRVLSEEKQELDRLNGELQTANRLLEEKNEVIRELTIFEERNRIARDIHDSVGHNLTGLVMNLDFCKKLADIDPARLKEQIGTCSSIARECLTEIRRSVQALKPPAVEQLPLIKSIEELAEACRQKFGMDVVYQVNGKIYKTSLECNIVIYRAVQEAVTNSVRHGKASRVEVTITFGEKIFSVLIRDNGQGVDKLVPGTGLTGMRERVEALGGSFSWYKNNGFMIHLTIPVSENIRLGGE
jgi:signal transduction histidine kinase